MKKNLLFIAALTAGLFQANAQCVIVPSCTPNAMTGYCAAPSASTNLPAGTLGTAYSTNIQFSLGTTAQNGAIPINGATITATSGLPAGLATTLNPTSGAIAGGGNACLQIAGTPSVAGSYTFSATFSVSTAFGAQIVNAQWYLTINANTTGIAQIAQPANVMIISPNPAKSELNITADFHIGKVSIIDALGKVVMSQDLNYTSQTTLDIHNLERGVYFLQANDGSRITTKKFIKD